MACTLAALAESLHALAEEEADTSLGEDTLHHGETLLVVATGDAEDVTLEVLGEGLTGHLVSHALVHEGLDDTVRLFVNDLINYLFSTIINLQK